MKKIINWIIDRELESLEDYPALAEPMSEEFDLNVETCTDIINTVIYWETDSNSIDSLEDLLNRKFSDIL